MKRPSWSSLALGLLVPLVVVAAAAPGRADEKQVRKVRSARWVCEKVLQNPERAVPRELLEDTRCVAIFPAVKEAAFGLGGRRGTGVASCRSQSGAWSPPSFVKITEGSIGLQLGYRASDVIFFIITERGEQALLRSRTALGGDASVSAGSMDHAAGFSSARDLVSDIYIYSESNGLFAGVSFEGTNLAVNHKAIRRYYDHAIEPNEILYQHNTWSDQLPPEAQEFMDALGLMPSRDPAEAAVSE